MPPRIANARNAKATNANATPPVLDQEVSNVKFKNAMQMVTQSMTNQNNWVHDHVNENDRLVAARVSDFVRMNPPEFLKSQAKEEPQNFLDEIKKIF